MENHMKNFKKSTGKILLASGLVVSMSACSVTSLFGDKEKTNAESGKQESKETTTEGTSSANSESKSSETKEKSTNSKEESKDVKMIMVLPEDYPQLMVDIEQDLLRRLDYYDASVRDWKKGSKSNAEVRDSIKDLDKVFDKLERIDAPGKYKADHKEIVKSVQKLRESFKEIEQLFDYSKTPKDSNDVIIDKANNKLDEAKRIWTPIFDKLKAEANGGSTTSTTSSSDKPSLASGNEVKTYSSQAKTGIFKGQIDTPDESSAKFKNVQNNYKDGTELVGNWGIDYGDGVKTTLVLKADKTFETYANGSYPNKDNYLTGTYQADVASHQLTLVVEKGTQNGQEVKLERPIYSSYEVKNLDGKALQIFHIDEQVTICYVKQ
ncbi:DUF3994 domain-containing protein [Bacillus sp. AFS054943]|uniref:DUF3994 domain-containing protein n=2 Tax=Bacillaceae TaxID=186817 RepID=UPI000B4989CB|nr:DUF3994 domain-containing protein [Bacillus cereus]PFA61970.1 DUF3994 domain-containing protein [Bacillus sp. AFS015896]PGL75842.1 DUF3994 domain-containing protein [Bacillus sp. AFS054943]PGX13636.1 DUF3994 domain-containing protein [Bacillus sp. AFS033286]PGZ71757.1 DUF3994 domain-containing protein [Bacillus sp. AFS029637]